MTPFVFVCLISCVATVQCLYPYGPGEGDTAVPTSDNGHSGEVMLDGQYVFYGQSYNSLWINVNGNMMFDGPSYLYGDIHLPFTDPNWGDVAMAPFWADVDLTEAGTIWYRESTAPFELGFATADIQCGFGCVDFTPSHAFIVTWDAVEHQTFDYTYCYNEYHTYSYYPYYYLEYRCFTYRYFGQEGTNTFQCILLTDGTNTFVIYIYDNIDWIVSDQGLLDQIYAMVGFNAGDGIRSWSHPDSETWDLNDVEETTNTGHLGVWKFKVDGSLVLEPGQFCPSEDMCTCSLTSSSFVYNFDGYPNNQIKAAQKTTLVEYNQGTVDPCKFRLRVETKADGANFSVKKVYFSVGVHPNNVDNHYRSIMISGNQVKERGHGINSQAVATPYWWMSSDTKTDLDVVEDGDWVRVRNTQCSWFLDVDRSHGNDDLRLTFTTGYTGGVVDGFCGNCDGVADPFMSHEDQTALWAVEDDD